MEIKLAKMQAPPRFINLGVSIVDGLAHMLYFHGIITKVEHQICVTDAEYKHDTVERYMPYILEYVPATSAN